MDPRLLDYYNRELQFMREMGAEFAQEFPKVAKRLGIEGLDVSDPYVERLLEGFAFLAARVQLKIDASFPEFSQHLFEIVHPAYLAPTPSMAVVRFDPDRDEGSLDQGFTIPRGSALRSSLSKGQTTPCEYRTAHDVTLWPIVLDGIEYFTHAFDVPGVRDVKGGIVLKLRATAGLTFDAIAMDRFEFFLHGTDDVPMRLYEQIFGHGIAVVVQPTGGGTEKRRVLGREAIRRLGFDDDQSLLPYGSRSFQGYRLLHEYFAFPERFSFVRLDGIGDALRACKSDTAEIVILVDRSDSRLEASVRPQHVGLYCTPAINVFEKRADRIHVTDRDTEFHIVPDRTRPLDYEVYDVRNVVGFGSSAGDEQPFRPFYGSTDLSRHTEHLAYYTVQRRPRLLSSKQRKFGTRSGYVGHEVYLSLVDANQAPFASDLRQLDVTTLCTNRDLPILMSLGSGRSDFSLLSGAPVSSIRCVKGPTRPSPTHAHGETAWRLISHLSLNYLSLADSESGRGAAALRDLLGLYADLARADVRKQVDGVRSVASKAITRRLPVEGPLSFGRGLEIEVTLDDSAFEGVGVFLLGAVLDAFFAKYVSINSFTETVVRTVDRGEVVRWPARIGRRHAL